MLLANFFYEIMEYEIGYTRGAHGKNLYVDG